jgi:glycosyltransferase involved in cell wall biosynthesis
MTGQKLKIAISIWSFTPNTGGLQAHAEQLCQNLLKQGHEVTVVTRSARRIPHGRDYLFFNEPEAQLMVKGVRVKPLRFARLWVPVLWFLGKCVVRPQLENLAAKLYQRVARTSAREAFAGVDIIHHVGEAPTLVGFAAAAAAKYWQVPFVAQPTCHPHHVGDSPLDFQLFAKADRLLVHTQYEGDYFRQKSFCSPIDVVGNGIEDRGDGVPARFKSRYGVDGPFILYAGRKDQQKGYYLLTEAFKLVRRQRPDLGLVCMGPFGGSPDSRLKIDGLIDLDFVSEEEKHDALAACTCLCVPSVGESFGLIFMEAGRYAKPVIGRNVPVLRELWDEGAAGLLVGQLDAEHNSAALSPEELAAALLKLLSDAGECRRLGENLQKISARFVWPKIVENFEASYHQALETYHKPANKVVR